MKTRKIAFVPGAFRPFGDHHMRMVKHYSDMCDEVVLVVSSPKTEDGKRKTNVSDEITPEQAKSIIELCIGDSGLDNVICQVSRDDNPIRTILKDISKLSDCDVVLGVSKKDDDEKRFDSVDLDNFMESNVNILPPSSTAFVPVTDECGCISAGDVRGHVDDRDMLRAYLPVFVEDDTFQKIYDILNGKSRDSLETHDELKFGSSIFEELVEASLSSPAAFELDEEETEFSRLRLDDAALDGAKCTINAYNVPTLEEKNGVYNPKTNPDKAVDMVFEFDGGDTVEIYLDTETGEWDSRVNDAGKLTPDQMGEFFRTDFSKKMDNRLSEIWPESDPFFKNLMDAVRIKKINYGPCEIMVEGGEFRKGNISKEKSKQKNASGEQIYTNSGRKIVSFSDFGVKHTAEEAYYCWPEDGKEFKWSQWQDWKKIKLLCRCRFQHNEYLYGLSLSLFPDDDENRGFRAYNLDLEPKLQYLTPTEASQIMDLSLVQKFLKNCLKRLNRFMSISDREILQRIDNPRCQLGDIRKTKHIIKNTMKAIRERRHDTYIYT